MIHNLIRKINRKKEVIKNTKLNSVEYLAATLGIATKRIGRMKVYAFDEFPFLFYRESVAKPNLAHFLHESITSFPEEDEILCHHWATPGGCVTLVETEKLLRLIKAYNDLVNEKNKEVKDGECEQQHCEGAGVDESSGQ